MTSTATSTITRGITATSTRAITDRTRSRRRPGRSAALVLGGILAWTAFAFGGIYPATLLVPALACLGLAAACRPSVLGRGSTPSLDRLLLAVVLVAAVQAVPLPRAVTFLISPASERVAATLTLFDTGGPLPLSIDLTSTAGAVLLLTGTVLLFVTARHILDSGGVRTTARSIAIIGLVLSAVAIAQDATGHGLMYWRWQPRDEGPAPFGPYVNRNHFATWALMAAPVCIGYLGAHTAAHRGASSAATWQRRLIGALDSRAWLLLAAAALLIVATAASLSRSGLIGLAAALVTGAVLSRHRRRDGLSRSARPVIFMVALGTFAALAVLARVGPSALANRFAASEVAVADRLTIWRDTTLVLQDFWLTGTGVGTFQTAMAVYQRSSPGVIFNQAHNHYLQVFAEGGLLVGIPALLALVAFARLAWRALQADASGMFWLRLGAVCGLLGVSVQSLFETGLTTPSNAALAAVLAALAIHVPVRSGPARLD